MHCGSCEILIGEELSGLPGVSEVKVDHKANEGVFLIDESKTSLNDALAAVERAGYQGMIMNEEVISTEEPLIQERKAIADTPFKVKIESRIEAQGKILEDSHGKPYFEGTIINSQSAEIDTPEEKATLKDMVNHVLRTVGNIQACLLYTSRCV